MRRRRGRDADVPRRCRGDESRPRRDVWSTGTRTSRSTWNERCARRRAQTTAQKSCARDRGVATAARRRDTRSIASASDRRPRSLAGTTRTSRSTTSIDDGRSWSSRKTCRSSRPWCWVYWRWACRRPSAHSRRRWRRCARGGAENAFEMPSRWASRGAGAVPHKFWRRSRPARPARLGEAEFSLAASARWRRRLDGRSWQTPSKSRRVRGRPDSERDEVHFGGVGTPATSSRRPRQRGCRLNGRGKGVPTPQARSISSRRARRSSCTRTFAARMCL